MKPKHQSDLVGRVQKHPSGFAFLISLVPGTPDTYVDKADAKFLMNRDLVRFSSIRDGKRLRARIFEILERGTSRVYGQFYLRPRPHVLTPSGDVFMVTGHQSCPPGHFVIADIIDYPSRKMDAHVQIDLILGEKPRPSDDTLIAAATLGLPQEFPLKVKLEARELHSDNDDDANDDRKDLTQLPFVTIDGADAKDFDDAVFVKTQSGAIAWTLYVAIADVSHYVRPGTLLDSEARRRSTSVYFPGEVIPMLPEALSNDLCSLIADTDKKVLIAEISFDRFAEIKESRFYPATIRSRARLTYDEVHSFFSHAPCGKAAPLKEHLTHARALFKKLLEQRHRRGALDFDFPELKFETNSAGVPQKIYLAPRFESHQLIEEFMVSANSAVAARLRNYPTLFRVHEAPDSNKLGDLNELLTALGVPNRVSSLTHDEIAKLLVIKNPVLHRAILRMQRQARYRFEPLGHFGLSLKDYLHFTSPIRRYPDLVVHRLLKEVLKNEKKRHSDAPEETIYDLATETSDKERRAMEAERFVNKRKACWYMMQKVGDEFQATVTDMSNNGIFATLPDGIEGYIPGEFDYDERKMRVRFGGVYLNVGSELTVQVIRVDLEAGRIEFGLAKSTGTRVANTPSRETSRH